MKPTNKNSAKTTQPNRRAAANKKKKIIISCVSALLAVVLVITLVSLFKKANMPALAYSTQYKIDEVTLGNVSTTISGSGSLTPVHSETLKASALLEALEEDSDSDDGDSASAQSESGEGMLNGGSTMPSQTPAVIVGGTVQSVAVRAGDIVDAGDEIATIIVESEETAEGEEATTRKLVAPYNAVILESYLHEGDAVTDSTSVVMLLSVDDGYTMTISVDENNISLIEFGQEVEISIDVSSEEMPTGYVTDISYNGSTSGSTTAYKISVTFDYVENTYPGMSVSAEIVIDRSEDGLLVPVSAIQTSGDTKYVYLAPSDAALADVYEDGELDVTKLTKVTVTEVASDGSYTLVEGDGLEEGDLVVVITMTSNETGSTASGGSGSGSFPGGSFGSGSFPGGSFPGGEMPDFGSFPFGS